ncbi:hypothetical protein AX16_010243 [Volvariella volvacea WC 439]|nr:hypothetical protein AX16_010243 [Volvariella volvacea WC 439]
MYQHYVPRFILRPFSPPGSQDETVCVKDRVAQPKFRWLGRILGANNLYTQFVEAGSHQAHLVTHHPDDEQEAPSRGDDTIETKFATIEGHTSMLLRNISTYNGGTYALTVVELWILQKFLLLQLLRHHMAYKERGWQGIGGRDAWLKALRHCLTTPHLPMVDQGQTMAKKPMDQLQGTSTAEEVMALLYYLVNGKQEIGVIRAPAWNSFILPSKPVVWMTQSSIYGVHVLGPNIAMSLRAPIRSTANLSVLQAFLGNGLGLVQEQSQKTIEGMADRWAGLPLASADGEALIWDTNKEMGDRTIRASNETVALQCTLLTPAECDYVNKLLVDVAGADPKARFIFRLDLLSDASKNILGIEGYEDGALPSNVALI